uniref:Uncharacterized protein n=1 Tax=Rhizophora mucronata TaxID=61149 RepID=A0A2P2Q3Y9_RHIMU
MNYNHMVRSPSSFLCLLRKRGWEFCNLQRV